MELVSYKNKDIILRKLFINQAHYTLGVANTLYTEYVDNQLYLYIKMLCTTLASYEHSKQHILASRQFDKNDSKIYQFTTLSMKDVICLSTIYSKVDIGNVFCMMLVKLEKNRLLTVNGYAKLKSTIYKCCNWVNESNSNGMHNKALDAITELLNESERLRTIVVKMYHNNSISKKDKIFFIDTLWTTLEKAVIDKDTRERRLIPHYNPIFSAL